jgi:fimbrial isopeptide formation D2 family protein
LINSYDINFFAFTVTFDGNGGIFTVGEETQQRLTREVVVGGTIGAQMPPSPSHPERLTFLSWNTARNGSGDTFTADTVVTDPITLFAQWSDPPPPQTAPTITKEADRTTVNRGDTIEYTITVNRNDMSVADFGALMVRDEINIHLTLDRDSINVEGADDWDYDFDEATRMLTIFDIVLASDDDADDGHAEIVKITFTVTVAQNAPEGAILNTVKLLGPETEHPNHDPNLEVIDYYTETVTVVVPSSRRPSRQPQQPEVIPNPEVPLGAFVSDHVWYVRGFPDGSFRPGQSITRAEVSIILWRLLDSGAKYAERTNNFSDVDAGWYARAVSYLASRGIVTGYEDGTFRPNAPITRAELTAIISRFFEFIEFGENSFTDVSDNHWALAYINNAYSRVWVNGYEDGTFRPNDATTRAEAVTLLNRVLERTPNPATINEHKEDYVYERLGTTRLFNDITNTHWAYYQIIEAAIAHEFELNAQDLEVWTEISIPWLDFDTPRL